MIRILAALLALIVLGMKGLSYFQLYQKGVLNAQAGQWLIQGNLLLIQYLVGILTSLVLVGIALTLLTYAMGGVESREKAARLLSRLFSDSGLIALLLLLLLFVALFK